MKGYYIEIKNDLLEPKHRRNMREAVWLFMWLLDKMTSIDENGVGKVLGGRPIKSEEVEKDLDISSRTFTRWVADLERSGYILTIRTPYGLSFRVNKAKKIWGRSAKSAERSARNADSSARNGVSNIRQYKTIQRHIGLENLSDRELRALVQR